MSIHGFDPLAPLPGMEGYAEESGRFNEILDEAIKGAVNNILKCYTGFYDLFLKLFRTLLMQRKN